MSEVRFYGIGVSEGICIGKAHLFRQEFTSDTESNITADRIEQEIERLQNAARNSMSEVEELITRSACVLEEDKLGVLKGQKSMLQDPAYLPEMEKLIWKKCFAPEKAVKQVTEKFAMLFESMDNAYMRERATDVRDAGNRLLKKLSGNESEELNNTEEPVILFAEDLSPADTIQLDRTKIQAFVTEKGGKTSHTAIFAKSMGIPAIVGASGILSGVKNGEPVLIDSAKGLCVIAPDEETVEEYESKQAAEIEERQKLNLYSGKTAETKDGRRVIVAANIGSAAEAAAALQQGAEQIGLVRTELLYLSRDTMPGEDEQFEVYKAIAETMGNRGAIIRTLDIGGDKVLPYLSIPKEENPFLGYRAIRLSLDRKDLFLPQLKAILRASAYGKLKIMFPMISSASELRKAKAIVEEAKNVLRASKIPFDETIPVGAMIEIPAAALTADALAKECDFFSIGTNDLTQYTLAVDRGNSHIAGLYDYCHPAVLTLVDRAARAAHANGIPIGMCGDMAGNPEAIPLLIGLGLDELSMAAGAVKKAKYTIHELETEKCEQLAAKALQCGTPEEVRSLL